jgi:RNA-binding protein YhbY
MSLLSSRLLSRNVKVKIYKTIILPAVSYNNDISEEIGARLVAAIGHILGY